MKGKLIWSARLLRQRITPGAVILLYHSIADVDADPHDLRVTPSRFSEHLQVLCDIGCPIALNELSADLEKGRIRRRSVVVTFDDGYADNLFNAKPLLMRFDVPATVFVTTHGISSDREFWWDEVERLVLKTFVSGPLSLQANETVGSWQVPPPEHDDLARQCVKWTLKQADLSPRHQLYRSVRQWFSALPHRDRDNALEQLRLWAGATNYARSTHRAMSETEIQELAKDRLVEVGVHSVTHPRLVELSGPDKKREVESSKMQLEHILGSPVSSFAYPHGCFDLETAALVRAAGYRSACSTIANFAHKRADRFALPRLRVRDWDGDTFARRLRTWLMV